MNRSFKVKYCNYKTKLLRVISAYLLISFLALLIAVSASAQSTESVEDRLTDILRSSGTISYPELLTQSDRLKLISLLKEKQLDPQVDVNTFYAVQRALLTLDDLDTVTSAVALHQKFDVYSDSNLSEVGTERVIDYIYKDLYLPLSVQHPVNSDVVFSPIREISARIIMSIVARSKLFPPATSTWARNFGGAVDDYKDEFHGDCWRIAVEWWEHNKEAILAHKYQNATWLPSDLAKPNTPTAEIVKDIIITGHLKTLTYLRRDQKELAIELLKKSKLLPDNDFNQITRALVMLDDIDTINTTISQYHRFDSRASDALDYSNEIVIERIGDDLSLPISDKDPNNKYAEPIRQSSAEIILGILERSTSFGKPTSDWAKSMLKSYKTCWKPVSEWWQHNKEAILAHRYVDATWLPPPSTHN